MRPCERKVACGVQGVNDSARVARRTKIGCSAAETAAPVLVCPGPVIDHQLNAGAALPRVLSQAPSQVNRPAP